MVTPLAIFQLRGCAPSHIAVRISMVTRAESHSKRKRKTDAPMLSGPGAFLPNIEKIADSTKASVMPCHAVPSSPGVPLPPRYAIGGRGESHGHQHLLFQDGDISHLFSRIRKGQ
jgi:hypothetical protein